MATIGHNSRNAPFVDPGPADDFVLAGPLFVRQANVVRDELNAFCAAIRSQGDQVVRHKAIDNAMVRHGANPQISNLTFRVLSAIAHVSHGKYRYHGMPMEALAYFAGQKNASNLHRVLKEMAASNAAVVIAVPRKLGGRPMKFVALICTEDDRTGAAVAALRSQARDRYDGVKRAERDGMEWVELVEDTIRPNDVLQPPASRHHDELIQPEVGSIQPGVVLNSSPRRIEDEPIRHHDVLQSVTMTTRVHIEDCIEEREDTVVRENTTSDCNFFSTTTSKGNRELDAERLAAAFHAETQSQPPRHGALIEIGTPPSAIYNLDTPERLELYNRVASKFGYTAADLIRPPVEPDTSDDSFRRALKVLVKSIEPAVLEDQLDHTLNAMIDMEFAPGGGRGLRGAYSYLTKSVANKAMDHEVAVRTALAKGQVRLEGGGTARKHGPAKSKSSIWDEFKIQES